jgi:hypothetical protein
MHPQFLTAAQLAKESGRNEKTIRRAIERGRLPADRDENGVYQIPAEAGYNLYPRRTLPPAVEPELPIGDKANGPQRSVSEQLGELRGVLQALRSAANLESLDDKHFREVVRGVLVGREL